MHRKVEIHDAVCKFGLCVTALIWLGDQCSSLAAAHVALPVAASWDVPMLGMLSAGCEFLCCSKMPQNGNMQPAYRVASSVPWSVSQGVSTEELFSIFRLVLF